MNIAGSQYHVNGKVTKGRQAGIAPVAQLLYGRDTVELQILYEPMSLPELMVVAHRRGYTVQPSRKVYQFMRHRGRP